MNRRVAALEALERRLGHVFTDRDLLDRALTHSSAGQGAREVAHNERLEFLGDRVLNLIVAEHLMTRHPKGREGELSKRMHGLINRETCARVARRLGMPEALRLDGGQSKLGGRDNDNILADGMEALIAALYTEAGLDKTRATVVDLWKPEFEAVETGGGAANPKSELQEWAAAHRLPIPRYAVVERTGPDHAPQFTVEAVVEGLGSARAHGTSRQSAEKAAAQALLKQGTGA